MNILIVIQLKVILVSLFLFGFLNSEKRTKEEYDLINFLACGIEDYALINKNFSPWNPWYDSYEVLNQKNVKFLKGKEKFELDEIFDENQRREIDDFLKSKHPSKVKSHLMKCKTDLKKTKKYVRGLTTYTYSFPIITKGLNHELYGIIIESTSFEADNGSVILKVFKKRSDSWDLIHERLIAFS